MAIFASGLIQAGESRVYTCHTAQDWKGYRLRHPAAQGASLRIIGNSPTRVRLSCEACDAHIIVDRGRLQGEVLCGVCGIYRPVKERRQRPEARDPERRVLVPAV